MKPEPASVPPLLIVAHHPHFGRSVISVDAELQHVLNGRTIERYVPESALEIAVKLERFVVLEDAKRNPGILDAMIDSAREAYRKALKEKP